MPLYESFFRQVTISYHIILTLPAFMAPVQTTNTGRFQHHYWNIHRGSELKIIDRYYFTTVKEHKNLNGFYGHIAPESYI